jgi:hypothetical protein
MSNEIKQTEDAETEDAEMRERKPPQSPDAPP